MSRLACSYENVPGSLTIAQRGFMFSCTRFEIRFHWKNVANISTGNRWQVGKSSATILVELVKSQAPILKASEESITKNSLLVPKTSFLFTAFHDFLGADDSLMRSWKDFKSRGTKQSERVEVSEPLKDEEEPVPSSMSNANWMSTALQHCKDAIQSSSVIHASVGGLDVTVLLVLLVSVLLLTGYSIIGRGGEPLKHSEELLHRLSEVRDLLPSVQQTTGEDYYASDQQRRALLGSSTVWIDRLQRSASELSRSFVSLQLKMISLRQKRAERILNHPHVLGDNGDAVHATYSRYHQSEVTRRRTGVLRWPFSLFQHVWRLQKTFRGFVSTLSLRRSFSPVESYVVYEETIGDRTVSQRVPVSDYEERTECQRIMSELVEVTQLTEEVFTQFIGVLMNGALDNLASGEERSHYWTSPASELGAGHADEFFFSDPESTLKVVWMRRHLGMLFHLDPLEASHQRRWEESLNYLKQRQNFAMLDSHLSSNAHNESNKEKLLLAFYKNIVLRGGAERRESLRNIVDEVVFWSSHDRLWTEHVMRNVTDRSPAPTGADNHNYPHRTHGKVGGQLSWSRLPVFRGLLCFSDAPQLTSGTADAAFGGIRSRPPPNIHRTGGERSYRLPLIEATAFHQVGKQISERWINELELLLSALQDTKGNHQRRPYHIHSLNTTVRSRLARIAKDIPNGLHEAKRLERDADPALQSAYSRMVSVRWDNMKNIPFSILMVLANQPQGLASLIGTTDALLVVLFAAVCLCFLFLCLHTTVL